MRHLLLRRPGLGLDSKPQRVCEALQAMTVVMVAMVMVVRW